VGSYAHLVTAVSASLEAMSKTMRLSAEQTAGPAKGGSAKYFGGRTASTGDSRRQFLGEPLGFSNLSSSHPSTTAGEDIGIPEYGKVLRLMAAEE